jgi:uncharacterized membrane protein
MTFFNSGFFWFLEGVLACVLFFSLRKWLKEHAVNMTIVKWILLWAWIVLVGFTFAYVGVCMGEGEATAAGKGGVLFGLISILSGAVLWRILKTDRSHAKSAEK